MNSKFNSNLQFKNKSAIDLKVIILGSSNVGKTAFIQRYLKGNFYETYTTIGASFSLKQWGDYSIAIWDTAGEEKFNGLSTFYCRGADVAIFAYDLTDEEETLMKLKFKDLLDIADPECLAIVIGTKSDLLPVPNVNKSDDISPGDLKNKSIRRHLDLDRGVEFFRTSALTGENVVAVFEYAFTEQILRRRRDRLTLDDGLAAEQQFNQSINLTAETTNCGDRGSRCC